MTNDFNERKSGAVIIAAVVTAFVIALCGTISGLILAVREHRESGSPDGSRLMAGYLLEDSALNLRSSMSALRLCNEPEPAETLSRTALVHAVRAETALECHAENWEDARSKEEFLNDISTVLHSYSPERTMEMAEKLYEFSSKFYDSVSNGTAFEYEGELIERDPVGDGGEVSEEDIAAAAELVKSAIGVDTAEKVGAWDGHIEFYVERDGTSGYAVVCGGKISEFSFMREESDEIQDDARAREIALAVADACGYKDLTVEWSAVTGKSVSVIMCKSYDGAMACDDTATAIVHLDTVVAFTSGGCEHDHKDIPSAKKTESQAREAVKDAQGKEGTLVVRTVNGKERICYEYRVELEDGIHYVYVCAENGKQMEVK